MYLNYKLRNCPNGKDWRNWYILASESPTSNEENSGCTTSRRAKEHWIPHNWYYPTCQQFKGFTSESWHRLYFYNSNVCRVVRLLKWNLLLVWRCKRMVSPKPCSSWLPLPRARYVQKIRWRKAANLYIPCVAYENGVCYCFKFSL